MTKEHTEALERAVLMLNVAAKYIENNEPFGLASYDGTDCDGFCLAEDCTAAAEALDDTYIGTPSATLKTARRSGSQKMQKERGHDNR